MLFGLAMDYEVFLVSRMSEDYVHGATPRRAVLVGFEHGSRVILAAAVIMVSVFVAFVFGGSTVIAPIAFAPVPFPGPAPSQFDHFLTPSGTTRGRVAREV